VVIQSERKLAMGQDATTRGNASQFFVAGELCRRGYAAVVTLGNTKNTDVLCSNVDGTKFVHIQVKTYIPGTKTCNLGNKRLKYYGDNFFWVLSGIPTPDMERDFEYFIIPSADIAENVNKEYDDWINGGDGRKSTVRTVHLPEFLKPGRWDISIYKNRWDLIEEKINASN